MAGGAIAFESPSSPLPPFRGRSRGSRSGTLSMAEQGGGPRRLLSSPLTGGRSGGGLTPGVRPPGRDLPDPAHPRIAWVRRRPAGLAGRKPAPSFALRAMPAGRRRTPGRDPPPDLPPVRGEESKRRRSAPSSNDEDAGEPHPRRLRSFPFQGGGEKTAAIRPFVQRRRCRRVLSAPSALLPPGRGEVGRGVTRLRSPDGDLPDPAHPWTAWERRRPAGLAGRRPAPSFALRAMPAGRRRSQRRDPPPDLPPEGGRRENGGDPPLRPTTMIPESPIRVVCAPPPFRGEVGRGVTRGCGRPDGIFPIPLIRELPGSAGVPPAWRAEGPHPRSHFARCRRDAGAPGGGTPLPTSPLKGGGEKTRGREEYGRRREGGGGPPPGPASGANACPPGCAPPPWKGGGREGGRSAAHRPRRRTKARPARRWRRRRAAAKFPTAIAPGWPAGDGAALRPLATIHHPPATTHRRGRDKVRRC